MSLSDRDGSAAPDWMRARLADMERSNRSLTLQVRVLGVAVLACIGGVVALVAAAGTAAESGDAIETSALILSDNLGVARAELSINAEGAAQIALRDRNEVDRLRLTVRSDGSPGITFADQEEKPRIVLGLLPDDTNTMVFADRSGVIRAVLGMSEGDRTNLVFADNSGVTRVGLGVDSRGSATVLLPETGPASLPDVDAPGGDS